MDTVQEVELAFKFSAKRVLDFEEQLMNNAAVREEMGTQSKLKVLCETRWASRVSSRFLVTGKFTLNNPASVARKGSKRHFGAECPTRDCPH